MDSLNVETPQVPPESEQTPSSHNILYVLIFPLSIFVCLVMWAVFAVGWEVMILLPIALVFFSAVSLIASKTLRRNNAGWWALLLTLLIICLSIVLTRLALVASEGDSDRSVYPVSFLAEGLLREAPDLPKSYERMATATFLATLVYLVSSLVLVNGSVKSNQGRVNPLLSVFILLLGVILLSYILWPLGSAWEKYKSPEHAGRMERQGVIAAGLEKISVMRGIFATEYKSGVNYPKACADFNEKYPDITCRAFGGDLGNSVVYFKLKNNYGYACADGPTPEIVDLEPTGLFCENSPETQQYFEQRRAAQSSVVEPSRVQGTPVGDKYAHVGISDIDHLTDCGIWSYKDNRDRKLGFDDSDCINKAIRFCQSAVISSVVDGLVSTYQIEREGNQCAFYMRFRSSTQPGNDYDEKCSIDPSIGWTSISSCIRHRL